MMEIGALWAPSNMLSAKAFFHLRYRMSLLIPAIPPQEAINLLEPMTNDPVNYVRQGALIASALIMIQQTEVTCPKVSDISQ